MRTIILAAFAIATFLTTVTIDRTDANAVVCGRGPNHAGSVGSPPLSGLPLKTCRLGDAGEVIAPNGGVAATAFLAANEAA
jgi:hypothetical protein